MKETIFSEVKLLRGLVAF